jgi:hypothetical protein
VFVCYNKSGKSKTIFDKNKFTHWRDDIWIDPVIEPEAAPEEVPEYDPQSAKKEKSPVCYFSRIVIINFLRRKP